MRLKKIALYNIRSYTSQTIEFSDGSVLLSGDIGSGKSTVLLAIEFALFGSKASELPASVLLRHGKNEGSVELHMDIDGKNIIVKRTLKRSKQGIKQEAGFIIIEGMKKDLSPVELRAEIFELIGYPKELVSKNKDLLYRYTVYTPQEDMKRIIMEDAELRLDTLRKVFNIDRYKRIRENTAIVSRALKEKSREKAGYITDLEQKKTQWNDFLVEKETAERALASLLPVVASKQKAVQEQKAAITAIESQIRELQRHKQEFAGAEAQLQALMRQRERNKETISALEQKIVSLQESQRNQPIVNMDDIKKTKENLLQFLSQKKTELQKIQQQKYEITALQKKSAEMISKIAILHQCPLCLQDVSVNHKLAIQAKEQAIISDGSQKISINANQEIELAKYIEESEKKKDELFKAEYQLQLAMKVKKDLEEKIADKTKIEEQQDELKKQVGSVTILKSGLQKKIADSIAIEADYEKKRKILEELQDDEKKVLLEKFGKDKEIEAVMKNIGLLQREIDSKEAAKKELIQQSNMLTWLIDFFVQLMTTIEKHVMVQVHREFNELLQNWFGALIEDDTIGIRLDEDFAPLLEQNGFETNLENLSGGEKTAVALAYRLALNKVVNDVVSSVKTKDILILDEPTDGFSAEQLDRMREILHQINVKQLIIVSHEPKIETFVDNVIRIGKREHQSSVVL